MIASVRGTVLRVGLDHAIIEAGGVGYRILATPATLATLTRGSEGRLWTTLVVRDDAHTLFGFHDLGSQEYFTLLQKVNGVGPKLALAILAVLDPPDLSEALRTGDSRTLTRVPGVGKKVADRLVMELAEAVAAIDDGSGADPVLVSGLGSVTVHSTSVRGQVVEALTGLGFPEKQAESATDTVLADEPNLDTAEALRAALAIAGATQGRRGSSAPRTSGGAR